MTHAINMRKFFFCHIGIFLLISTPCFTEPLAELEGEQAFTYAQQQLPRQGVLKKTDTGLLYLKITDRYIYELLPLLPDVLSVPPYFGPGLIGAHIAIIHPQEINWKTSPTLPPLGTVYSFTIDQFVWETPYNVPKAIKLCALQITSTGLEKIRTDAGLPKHFQKQPFSIMLGIQYLDTTIPPLEISKERSPLPSKNRIELLDVQK